MNYEALCAAAKKGMPHLQMLIKSGVDINAKDKVNK
jgi:hypothetical protein